MYYENNFYQLCCAVRHSQYVITRILESEKSDNMQNNYYLLVNLL